MDISLKTTCPKYLMLVLVLFLCTNCVTGNPRRITDKEAPAEKGATTEEKPQAQKEVSVEQKSNAPGSLKENSPPSVKKKDQSPPPAATFITNQELLDSALGFLEASNDYWEQGDLDNAIDALDKAYSLILKVNHDVNPDDLQQKEDLRITIAKRIIEVYTSRFTVANGDYKAIPLVMNDHVKKALDLFKGKERSFFLEAYRRSGIYRPAIVAALRKAGMPEELSWLPLIESGYKVRALSRARALGLWQFIASTGYKFGLKRDRWVDERMDSKKSTMAAIAYLKELHQIFGDWTTVLAAYNCGERRVLNRIRTQRINYLDDFWDLYRELPRETAFYVPKFLAVLHIINDPRAHGIELPPVYKQFEMEEVTINKQVHLKTIARNLEMDYELLKEMNPELRQFLTPKSPYSLKVPAGKGEILIARLSKIPAWRPPVPMYVVHRVRKGETLSVISERYKTTVRAIMAMNGLKRKNYLKVGWRLKIPAGKRFVASPKKIAVITPKGREQLSAYRVKKGDSLWKIANRFNTTTREIRSLNQLGSNRLQIGQVLSVPKGTTTTIYKGEKAKKYRVRPGDSPYLIAKKYQMNLSEFLKFNGLTPRSTIYPGQLVNVKAF